MIEEALRTRLIANSSLTAIVGTRIFPLEIPQGDAVPAVVYQIININPRNAQAGCVYDDYLIQYSCFSTSYKQAREMAEIIRSDLDRFCGTLDGVYVPMIRFEGLGANDRGSDTRYAHVSYDFRIFKHIV